MIHRKCDNMIDSTSLGVYFGGLFGGLSRYLSRTLSRRLLNHLFIYICRDISLVWPSTRPERVPLHMPNTPEPLNPITYVLYATKSTMDGMVDDGPVD